MWVFGYGSLTWKADFPFATKENGYIKGFKRRFYQHSVDHRGVPERPGRVVTLLPGENEDRVYGVAYYIPPENEESVMAHLDYREKDGYKKETVVFHPLNCAVSAFEITLYNATETNQWFAGPAEIPRIAEQIIASCGPSGPNTEYLFNLAQAMREIAPEHADEHLFDLEREVQSLLQFQKV